MCITANRSYDLKERWCTHANGFIVLAEMTEVEKVTMALDLIFFTLCFPPQQPVVQTRAAGSQQKAIKSTEVCEPRDSSYTPARPIGTKTSRAKMKTTHLPSVS